MNFVKKLKLKALQILEHHSRYLLLMMGMVLNRYRSCSDFKLTKLPDEEEEREDGEQGLFFVGMKEAHKTNTTISQSLPELMVKFILDSFDFQAMNRTAHEWKENPDDGNNPRPLFNIWPTNEWLQTKLRQMVGQQLFMLRRKENLSEHAYSTDYQLKSVRFSRIPSFSSELFMDSAKKRGIQSKIVRLNQGS